MRIASRSSGSRTSSDRSDLTNFSMRPFSSRLADSGGTSSSASAEPGRWGVGRELTPRDVRENGRDRRSEWRRENVNRQGSKSIRPRRRARLGGGRDSNRVSRLPNIYAYQMSRRIRWPPCKWGNQDRRWHNLPPPRDLP